MRKYLVRKIIEVGRRLYREGLVDGLSGNISCFYRGKILITRSRSSIGFLEEEDVLELPFGKEHPLRDRASTEIKLHETLIRETGKRCVLHCHPPSAIVLSLRGESIRLRDKEGIYLFGGEVEVLEGDSLPEYLKGKNLAMVKGHGVFCVGEDLEDCYKLVSAFESSCKVALKAQRFL